MGMINCYMLVATNGGPAKYTAIPFKDDHVFYRSLDDVDATNAAMKILPTNCNVEQSFVLLEVSATRGTKMVWWCRINGSEGTRRMNMASTLTEGLAVDLNTFAIKTLLNEVEA